MIECKGGFLLCALRAMYLKTNKILLFILCFLLVVDPVLAQQSQNDTLPKTCDRDVMDVMNLRAQLEGEREMEVAAALILKPDSVLEYSCFGREVVRLGILSQRLFSANTNSRDLFMNPPLKFEPKDLYQPKFESPQGPKPEVEGPQGEGIRDFSHPPDPSDNREKYPGFEHFKNNISKYESEEELGNMVMDSLYHYLDQNFRHSTLGGAGPNYNNCDMMNIIWNVAKCDDYYMTIGFETLKKFPEQYDQWPQQWAQCPRQKAPSDRWQQAIEAVNPKPNQSAGVEVNVSSSGPTAYMPELKTGSCSTAKAVMTGVTVVVGGKKENEDGVCLMPGCTFNNGSCS